MSYRPVRLVGLLLVLQAVGLAGLVIFNGVVRVFGWRIELLVRMRQPFETFVVGGAFVAAAVMAAVAAAGFLFLRRRGWILAALAQTLCLGASLALYADPEPLFVYPVMAYCILMILYLNSRDVREIFHAGRERRPDEGLPGGGA